MSYVDGPSIRTIIMNAMAATTAPPANTISSAICRRTPAVYIKMQPASDEVLDSCTLGGDEDAE